MIPWRDGAELAEVGHVIRESPAQAAGIEAGDQIVEIDGKPISAVGVDAVRGLLSQAPGTRVTLSVRRGGVETEKTLVLQKLI